MEIRAKWLAEAIKNRCFFAAEQLGADQNRALGVKREGKHQTSRRFPKNQTTHGAPEKTFFMVWKRGAMHFFSVQRVCTTPQKWR
ncbi:hypothetical protein Poly41_42090 [Novipirellula artificiosorum]|uniref:Uncharacterized protein n=1 Tax=Novipirellula artificiosorum TaxID=2528016 RepID=A0A5C6DFV2_9BACT|nr:hypothetical protein Poly41_42090 [Novipirellula artificiosorum]